MMFKTTKDSLEAEVLLKFINNNLRREVELYKGVIEILIINTFVFGVIGAIIYCLFTYK